MKFKSIHSRIKKPLYKLIWDILLIGGGIFNIIYYYNIHRWISNLIFFCLGSVLYWTTTEDLINFYNKSRQKTIKRRGGYKGK